jgi:hypothetical protein
MPFSVMNTFAKPEDINPDSSKNIFTYLFEDTSPHIQENSVNGNDLPFKLIQAPGGDDGTSGGESLW